MATSLERKCLKTDFVSHPACAEELMFVCTHTKKKKGKKKKIKLSLDFDKVDQQSRQHWVLHVIY